MWITYCIDIVVMKWIHTYSFRERIETSEHCPFHLRCFSTGRQKWDVKHSAIIVSLSNWRFFSLTLDLHLSFPFHLPFPLYHDPACIRSTSTLVLDLLHPTTTNNNIVILLPFPSLSVSLSLFHFKMHSLQYQEGAFSYSSLSRGIA
jgi:hypothetical protein